MPHHPLTLALTGNVMLGQQVNDAIAARGAAYPWGDLLPLLHQADAVLINLECALTSQTTRWHNGAYKTFSFRADPSAVHSLTLAHVSFAALANNHSGDFGMDGLLETVQVLDQAGIAHAGAGADLAAAAAPARLTVDGVRISIVAFADYPAVWAATPDTPGINYLPISLDPADFAIVRRLLAAARQEADLVICSLHWGPHLAERPSRAFRRFARAVIDAGADLVWGHSAHLVQGVERWQDKLILYDTGDFVNDYAVDPVLRNDRSALFLVQVRPPQIEQLELVPVTIAGQQVNLARGEDHAWFVQRFNALCAEFGTTVAAGPRGPVIASAAAPPAAAQPPVRSAGASAMPTPASTGSTEDDQAPARRSAPAR